MCLSLRPRPRRRDRVVVNSDEPTLLRAAATPQGRRSSRSGRSGTQVPGRRRPRGRRVEGARAVRPARGSASSDADEGGCSCVPTDRWSSPSTERRTVRRRSGGASTRPSGGGPTFCSSGRSRTPGRRPRGAGTRSSGPATSAPRPRSSWRTKQRCSRSTTPGCTSRRACCTVRSCRACVSSASAPSCSCSAPIRAWGAHAPGRPVCTSRRTPAAPSWSFARILTDPRRRRRRSSSASTARRRPWQRRTWQRARRGCAGDPCWSCTPDRRSPTRSDAAASPRWRPPTRTTRPTGPLTASPRSSARSTRDSTVELALVDDDPADALVNLGAGAALLVVGSRGLGSFRGMLLGSVSQAVLREATVPVVVVHDNG